MEVIMLNNEMLEDIKITLDEYFENGLNESQIIHIDNKLNLFPINEDIIDRYSLLKYTCLIRNEILEYYVHNVNIKERSKYLRYNTTNYSILRTLSNIDETIKSELIEDNILESQIEGIESSLKRDLVNNKKYGLRLI